MRWWLKLGVLLSIVSFLKILRLFNLKQLVVYRLWQRSLKTSGNLTGSRGSFSSYRKELVTVSIVRKQYQWGQPHSWFLQEQNNLFNLPSLSSILHLFVIIVSVHGMCMCVFVYMCMCECVYACVYTYGCHSTHVEVRGQLCEGTKHNLNTESKSHPGHKKAKISFYHLQAPEHNIPQHGVLSLNRERGEPLLW